MLNALLINELNGTTFNGVNPLETYGKEMNIHILFWLIFETPQI